MERSRNLNAFLDMLGVSELGVDLIRMSDHGYNVNVGSTKQSPILFEDYSVHPKKRIFIPKIGMYSDAAGKFQIMGWIYDAYKERLKLKGFYPEDQIKVALQLIRECRALTDIETGNIKTAIEKCRSRWASLPMAGYGQNEHSMDYLLKIFAQIRLNSLVL